jgi:alpha-D-xyloside xylohydrolase
VKAYSEFVGPQRVLFSRAGHKGQQAYPLQWAGDQQSTWAEFRHILTAGLSAGLSGIPFWGFDIAGFAGPLPGVELYERATQMAVFAPVMQWHSEPDGGQFKALMPGSQGINDRSPWNMAEVYGDKELVRRLRFHHNLRYNLLPYIYDCALKAADGGLPVMKHLVLEYSQDIRAQDTEDCFMLGDILVAPVLEAGITHQSVYLPDGGWTDLWDGTRFEGGRVHSVSLSPERTPAFVRDGGCIALNLGDGKTIGSRAGNRMDGYAALCFCTFGNAGSYDFRDDLGNHVHIVWQDGVAEGKTLRGSQPFTLLRNLW